MNDKEFDNLIVDRIKSGEKSAYNILVVKYRTRISKLMWKFLKNNSDVDDLTQDAFIKCYLALDKFRGDSAFYTWLYRISVNTAKNHLLSLKKKPLNIEFNQETLDTNKIQYLTDINSPEDIMISEELSNNIFNSIKNLTKDLKKVIILRELEGLSYNQISKKMSCPVGTVRSRLFRAREIIDRNSDIPKR